MSEINNIIAEFVIKKTCFLDADSQLQQPLPSFASKENLLQLYRYMSLTRAVDTKAVNLQRTGQMSTYPSSRGQEAVSVAIGDAMRADDVFCPCYRDQGAFIQRGVGIAEIYNYWGGDERGSAFINNKHDLPVCVPIAGQYLHATGVAYAMQYRQQPRAVVTTGGDGSTSKGDFYEAMNMAGVFNLPVVFVINNNQWAISVPLASQTACQTIAQKAIAAGIPGIQVDGNDVIAVRDEVGKALDKARSQGGPTLIEAVNYRLCDHTTADDATRYQDPQEVKQAWKLEPIARLAHYMEREGFWSKEQEVTMQASIKQEVEQAVAKYLAVSNQPVTDLVDYLYAQLPDALIEQRDELGET